MNIYEYIEYRKSLKQVTWVSSSKRRHIFNNLFFHKKNKIFYSKFLLFQRYIFGK